MHSYTHIHTSVTIFMRSSMMVQLLNKNMRRRKTPARSFCCCVHNSCSCFSARMRAMSGCNQKQRLRPPRCLQQRTVSRTTAAFALSEVGVDAYTSQRVGRVDPSRRRRARTSTCDGCSGTNTHHPMGASRDRRGTCHPYRHARRRPEGQS